ncbi:S-adenosylmethionine decarboxylase proenzyme precursor [Mycobacterium tuberculosis]|jgi:S-adenosylmethionine decarboxylase proenzyme|nr:S-adenosylmethionine decarboxylase proenzyme precursor [Mycobacterium tuberculosis]
MAEAFEFGFTGTHVLSDVTDVAAARITDNQLILDAVHRGVEESGATLCGVQYEEFEPVGMTAVFVLSESHVSVHTYPEQGSVFVDAFTCGTRCDPRRIVDALLRALGPCEHRTTVMHRGGGVRLHPVRRESLVG